MGGTISGRRGLRSEYTSSATLGPTQVTTTLWLIGYSSRNGMSVKRRLCCKTIPSRRTQIHVFISHSWAYSGHYDTLADWIFKQKWHVGQASLMLQDYSVPKGDPIHNAGSDRALQAAIFNQIARCHVVVIPLGMYANYSKWIQKEITGASPQAKPILGVDPWGQQRSSSVVANAAKEMVGWNSKSVVGGIWRLYRD